MNNKNLKFQPGDLVSVNQDKFLFLVLSLKEEKVYTMVCIKIRKTGYFKVGEITIVDVDGYFYSVANLLCR